MIEKLMKKIAKTEAFKPEDQLSGLVKNQGENELSEDSLDMVFAARKEGASYAEFLKYARERDKNRK